MPEFEVTDTDGAARQISARRMTREGPNLSFLDIKSGGGWRVVESVDCDRVKHVTRRFTEANGVMRWVTQPIPNPSDSPRWSS